MNNREIKLGSGTVYCLPYEGSIPSSTQMESLSNIIGLTQSGSSLKYKPTYKDLKNYKGDLVHSLLTSQEATFHAQLITYDKDSICRIIRTASVDTDGRVIISSVEDASNQEYIIHFVSQDGKRSVTLVGLPTSSVDFAFQVNNPSTLQLEMKAIPHDNKLLIYEEFDVPTPVRTIDITENGEHDVAAYQIANVNVTPETSGNAITTDVLAGKTFMNASGGPYTGTMSSYAGSTIRCYVNSMTSTNMFINIPATGYFNTRSRVRITPSSNFGNVTPADVIKGKTFTSVEGYNLVGTYEAGSSATGNATSDKVLAPYTFSNSTGTDLIGTMQDFSSGTSQGSIVDTSLFFAKVNVGYNGYYTRDTNIMVPPSATLGNATTDKVLRGIYFTSSEGYNLEGTYEPSGEASGNASSEEVLKSYTFSNDSGLGLTGTMNNWTGSVQNASPVIVTSTSAIVEIPNKGFYTTTSTLDIPPSPKYGNAKANQVLKGTHFTSSEGYNLVGTYEASPGSSGNATSAQVLAPYTFSNDTDQGLTGSIPTRSTEIPSAGHFQEKVYTAYHAAKITEAGYYPAGAELQIPVSSSIGDASPSSVLKGKTFSSQSGMHLTGSYVPTFYIGTFTTTTAVPHQVISCGFRPNYISAMTTSPIPPALNSWQLDLWRNDSATSGWSGIESRNVGGSTATWQQVTTQSRFSNVVTDLSSTGFNFHPLRPGTWYIMCMA